LKKKKICRNCVFWGKPIKSDYCPEIYAGKCNSMKLLFGDPREITTKDELLYVSGDDYHSSVSTGEEFGCIHWLSKK